MSEADAIDRADDPVTVDSLIDDLHEHGVEPGATVIVHTSMSELGWVAGGAPAVVDALMAAVTESGTLVMPTHSTHYLDPSDWENPPIPDDWVPTVKAETPAFRPRVTPTRGMGAVVECFRTYPDVKRSTHPGYSFAAWGANAGRVVADHDLDYGLGEGSPLATLYDLDADVLLLGVDHDRNTSLHLAEHRSDIDLDRVTDSAPILRDGERVYVEFEDAAIDSSDFVDVGTAFEQAHAVDSGQVGVADATRIPQPDLVDFAADWFEEHR